MDGRTESTSSAVEASGIVIGSVRLWLRWDALVMFAVAIAAFFTQGQPWWLIPLILFLPDVFMVGYLGSTRIGAFAYNLGHSYALPAATCILGLWLDQPLAVAIGALWFAHIGMDRVAGYGLKYPDSFAHTHLGWLNVGKKGRGSRATAA